MSVTDVMFVIGAAAACVGAFLLAPAAAILAGGVLLMLLAGMWENGRSGGDAS